MSRDTRCEQTDPVYEVEFSVRSRAYPFVSASEEEDCAFELVKMVPRRNGQYAEFFNVTGTEPDRILDHVGSHETAEVSLLRAYDQGGLFEFAVSGCCPAVTLAELGALPREVHGVGGEGRIVAEIPPQCEPSTVIERFLEEASDVDLVCKRGKNEFTPLFSCSTFQQVLHSSLTDRQREVLRAAYEAGYYDWPRQTTGEDVASTLGIASATFSEHIHAAERNLFRFLFDGPD